VIAQRQDSEALSNLVGRPFAKVGGEVRGIGRAAAVANGKNLPVFAPRSADGFGGLRDGVEGPVLGGNVILEPVFHDWGWVKRSAAISSAPTGTDSSRNPARRMGGPG